MSNPSSTVYFILLNNETDVVPFIPRQSHPFKELKLQKCVSGWIMRDNNQHREFIFVAGSDLFKTSEESKASAALISSPAELLL